MVAALVLRHSALMQHGDGITDLTDGPPAARRPGAWRLLLCVGLGLVVVTTVVVFVFIRVNTPPWEDMERSLNSFPVPAGQKIIDRNRQGQGRFHSIDPGCPTPLLFFWVVADGMSSQPDCSSLADAVNRWDRFVNKTRSSKEACAYQGDVDGHPVSVRLVDNTAAGTGRGHEINISMAP